MRCFLNSDSCIKLSQSAFWLCLGWDVTKELLLAESSVTADASFYWTAPEHSTGNPRFPNSSSLSPVLAFWGTFPRFSSYLKYCSVCLLSHKFFREVRDSPLKAQPWVLEGKLPWNHIHTNLDMYLRKPLFSSYFQKDLRSLKIINHCPKYF